MTSEPTAQQNILRVLRHLGLADSVTITDPEGKYPNKFFCWPRGDGLIKRAVLKRWKRDPKFASMHFHGTDAAFREPGGVHPCLQVCFHETADYVVQCERHGVVPPEWLTPEFVQAQEYFIEIDLDESAPGKNPINLLWHGAEVLRSQMFGKSTDQNRIAKLINKRFGKEA